MTKFLVSAGHGDGDPGNTSNNRKEADIAVELRNIITMKLKELGHDVVTDGTGLDNWALARAMKLITGRVSIEIHTNAGSAIAKGVETVSLSSDKELAQRISNNISKTMNIPVRRIKGWLDPNIIKSERGFFPGFVRSGGLIIETFFQSNKDELATYDAKKWLIAQAIVDALLKKAYQSYKE